MNDAQSADSIRNPTITALILAGGQAARMGGVDKGLVECAGQPLIARVLHKVEPLVGNVLISANRNLPTYAAYGYPVLCDSRTGYSGPLAGIESGLRACETEYLWIVPCDAPLFEAELLQRLVRACLESACAAVVPTDDMRVHATFALLHSDVRPSLQEFLTAGKRKARDWLSGLPAIAVDCSDHAEWFTNINTVEDLEACQHRIRSMS
ncbi:MAG: molybdenum cofactor guanylyltransferase MobA [Thiohalobacteraceae bacterium]